MISAKLSSFESARLDPFDEIPSKLDPFDEIPSNLSRIALTPMLHNPIAKNRYRVRIPYGFLNPRKQGARSSALIFNRRIYGVK